MLILVLLVNRNLIAGSFISPGTRSCFQLAHLIRFCGRPAALVRGSARVNLNGLSRDGRSLIGTGGGRDAGPRFCSCSMHLSRTSSIFILRRDIGIRLIRMSIRDRRPCA